MSALAQIAFLLTLIVTGSAAYAGLEKQGKLSAFASTMPGQTDRNASGTRAGGEFNLDLNYSFNDRLKLRLQPWLKGDGLNKSPEEKYQFDVLELNLSWKKNSTQVKLGLSSLSWEGPDFLNPMDLTNAKSYRDPLNLYTRSSPHISLSTQKGNWGIDAVYIPWRSPDLLPGNNSIWLPRYLALPTENEDTKLLIPDQVQYDIRTYQIIDDSLRHNGALRLRYQGDLWDFSMAAAEETGSPLLHPIANATILVAPAKVLQLQNPIIIQPVYYKQRTAAFAFSKAWETWILRLSAKHSQPISNSQRLSVVTETGPKSISITVPSWSQFGVIELEKHFSVFDQDLTVIAEYAQNKKPESSGVSSFSDALQNVYLIGFRFPFKETWTSNGAFFQDYKTKANYVHAGISKSWNDHWSSDIAADLFAGGDDSLLGVYGKNDQFSLKTNFAF